MLVIRFYADQTKASIKLYELLGVRSNDDMDKCMPQMTGLPNQLGDFQNNMNSTFRFRKIKSFTNFRTNEFS